MSKYKLKMSGVYTEYNTTDRILTMTEISLQGLSKTRVFE